MSEGALLYLESLAKREAEAMTQAPIELQDLRRKIYAKAKADKRHRF